MVVDVELFVGFVFLFWGFGLRVWWFVDFLVCVVSV